MKQKGKILIILFVVAILILGIAFYKSKSINPVPTPQPTNTAEQTKTFQSKNLKFNIDLPSKFEIQEKFTSLLLKSDNGEIVVSRVATNFDNLDSYIKDLSQKNKIEIMDNESKIINGLSSIVGRIKNVSTQELKDKIYFIYSEGWIYSLSTSSQSLYSDLDQIAKSFRYNSPKEN